MTADAIVVGAGPNGLVAANLLADAGWDVLVVEAQSEPGGAVRTGESAATGFRHDLYSAFYPLGAASPVMRALDLDRWGLRWRRAEVVVAHPGLDGTCATLATDLDETVASLEAFADGDGAAWRRLYELWESVGPTLIDALMSPFPPVRAGLSLVGRLRARGLLRLARFATLPVRTLGEEAFRGDGGPRLLAGNALHADLTPASAGGGLYGWLLCGLGQQIGFPVPEGGAGRLSDALVARLRAGGGEIRCGDAVSAIDVRGGRACGVRTTGGAKYGARRAVIAAVSAQRLYERLLPRDAIPESILSDLRRFALDSATVKVDWALDGPIPWSHPDARRAGTVHVSEGLNGLDRQGNQLARHEVPDQPFMVLGQYASFDPTRHPDGCESAWAYAHVPQDVRSDGGPDAITGTWDERETTAFVARMEAQVEALAPGFGDLIRARSVWSPRRLEATDANLVGGSLNGGTAQVHQQLVFRPFPGLARPETPVGGLYLGSSSAHPGGGVHGACGANAARAAMHRSLSGTAARRLARR